MYSSSILRTIKWADTTLWVAFLLLIGIAIFFDVEEPMVWDWTTRGPYMRIFNCLIGAVIGFTYRIFMDYVKFRMEFYLNEANKK